MPQWTAAELPRLEGRTFVVTGANSGIGLAHLSSVRSFADAWDGPVDVLVNNAGYNRWRAYRPLTPAAA
jgi:NAD(P)-dependent dehydrogenase (short-subunit alcohol dehydrogenase family)